MLKFGNNVFCFKCYKAGYLGKLLTFQCTELSFSHSKDSSDDNLRI